MGQLECAAMSTARYYLQPQRRRETGDCMSVWSVPRDWQGLESEPAIVSLSQDLEWVSVTTFQNKANAMAT